MDPPRHRHARRRRRRRRAAGRLAEWPPAGAEPVDVERALRAARRGRAIDYGPAFQGLRARLAARRRRLAEVALPEDSRATRGASALHPALLDAALHAALLAGRQRSTGEPPLPFAWNGVSLHARGRRRALRVRIAPARRRPAASPLADGDRRAGRSRRVAGAAPGRPRRRLAGRRPAGRSLLPARVDTAAGSRCGAASASGRRRDCRRRAGRGAAAAAPGRGPLAALERMQAWLDDERRTTRASCVVTAGAVATGAGEDRRTSAAARGLGPGALRAGRAPGRFVLVDIDGTEALGGRRSRGRARPASRSSPSATGELLVPRLARAPAPRRDGRAARPRAAPS